MTDGKGGEITREAVEPGVAGKRLVHEKRGPERDESRDEESGGEGGEEDHGRGGDCAVKESESRWVGLDVSLERVPEDQSGKAVGQLQGVVGGGAVELQPDEGGCDSRGGEEDSGDRDSYWDPEVPVGVGTVAVATGHSPLM